MENVLNVKLIEEANKLFVVLPYITSLACAIIAGFISWFVAHKQANSAIKELEKKYKLDFEQYQKQDLYEMRKQVIFKALTLFDDYVSWLTIDGSKPIRNLNCSNAKFTFQARTVYNELCVTVDNEKLVTLFNDIFFGNTNCFLGKLSEFRREARKELGLSQIEFPSGTAFILKVSADDLTEFEKNKNNYHPLIARKINKMKDRKSVKK